MSTDPSDRDGESATVDGSGTAGTPLVEVEDAHTYYGESHILEGISLDVREGENVALIGRNGVGKTTTLRTILQLTPPRRGTVRIKGEDVTGMRTHEVARRGVGWIPEDRRMFAELTVEENLRVSIRESADVAGQIGRAFDTFPDLQGRRSQKAGNLSGGQQQMLAIARGLVGNNDILLVDEPSEGLAPQIVERVAEALREVSESGEATLLLVEQNFPLAVDLADRFYLVDHGQVVESGSTEGLTSDDERIARYLGA